MDKVKKISKIALVIILLTTAFLGYKVKDIEFDYDFEAFFPIDDPETEFFEAHRQRFESDNDFIFISLSRNEGVFDATFLNKVNAFADSLSKDSLINDVRCITKMEEYIKTPFSKVVLKRPYINLNEPENFAKDSARIFKANELVGFFINQKATSLLLYVKHQQYLSKKKCDELKIRIDNLIAHYEFTDFKYAGRSIGMGFYINKMQYETGFFIGLSFILVIAFLIIAFRSFWGIWVPLTIVSYSMIWIVGLMAWIGQPINLILTVLPSIIFVVAMSDVIHLVSKYFDELRAGKEKLAAIKTAYKEVGIATLMTSITTSVGFLTLLTVNLQPVKDFGIYIAIGVMLAFVLAYTLLPALLILTKVPKVAQVSTTNNMWYKALHFTLLKLFRYRFATLIGFGLILVTSVIGVALIQSNYFLLEDLSKESSLRKDYEYFDKEFMGLRPFELAVTVKDPEKNIYNQDVLKEIDKVEQFLQNEYGLKQCFSIVSVLKFANRTEHGGQPSYYKLPNAEDTEKFIEQFKNFDKNNTLATYVDSTQRYGRISSTIGDVGYYAIREKNKKLNTFLNTEINLDLVDFQLTGTGHLLDANMSSLSKNLLKGLLLSFVIIGLLMGLLYRSIKMVLIALTVNIFPLLLIGAILGYTGVDLKVSTAIIFTISFGIAVDDTLHFMSRFKLELNKGKSKLYALKRTFLSTGRAIVLTTLILCAGFLLLLFSDFLGTFYVGLLISLSLFFALIVDLLLLPILLLLFYNEKKRGVN